jgi:stearoyl-CoA desaturase (delta-9 desaturase)
VYLTLFVVMVFATGFGVTIGYHRLFTHRSFETPRPMAHLLAILGSMAVQGPLIEWVATHRKHHQHSDEHDDPHSPHGYGEDFIGVAKGLFHAHVGWLFLRGARDIHRYSGDLRRDPGLSWTSKMFVYWVLLGLVLPAVIGGLLTLSWMGVLLGFLWGGLARIFFVHHVTWSINSVCHLWGAQPFPNEDESRNNPIFGLLAFGEGWHNNHHAFPTSARHGLAWWQFDISYVMIRLMGLVGLARKIKVPDRERIESKRTPRIASRA